MNSDRGTLSIINEDWKKYDPTYSFSELAHIISIYNNLKLPVEGAKEGRRTSTFILRVKAAWKVFVGKADALVW